MPKLPIIAVVGRPNIGKSTLVNRVIGKREAVVEELPGVTRDRREFAADWAGRQFLLIDTGGWQVDEEEHLAADISAQAEAAVAVADVVLFVVDATTSLTDDDMGIAKLVRGARKVVLAANKVDSTNQLDMVSDLWSLGLGEPFPVSALHGRGVGDLLDQLVHFLPEGDDDFVEDEVPKLAIIGRPNVGKSTLLNHLAGEQRVLVSPVPGTTRDPIDVRVVLDGQEYLVIDTAGMRRQPKIKESADFYSVQRAKRVAAESDVALLVVDAVDGVTAQDQRIAEEVRLSGTAMIIVANKWDIADADQRDITEDGIADRLGFCSWAPLLRMSAKTGARTHRLPKTIVQVLESSQRRLSTGKLNRLITEWTQAHPPPVRKGRRPKVLYAVQAGIRPPTFILFVAGGELGDDYLRFIENRLREAIDFSGTPVHVVARKRAARER